MKNFKKYSIQEFANMCHTTKDTLFHYHKLKLIKPTINPTNHYREYTSQQLLTFHRISLFKKSGCTLLEIEDYLYHRDKSTLQPILEENRHRLNVKLKETQRAIQQLNRIEDAIDYTRDASKYEPYLEEHPEKRYIVKTPYTGTFSWDGHEMDSLCAHIDYCETQDKTDIFPLGYICRLDRRNNIAVAEELYSFSQTQENEQTYGEIPEGKYLCILHKGSIRNMGTSIEKLTNYASTHNIQLPERIYVSHLIDSFTVFDSKDFVTQIFANIEK